MSHPLLYLLQVGDNVFKIRTPFSSLFKKKKLFKKKPFVLCLVAGVESNKAFVLRFMQYLQLHEK
jgi:hypothetical protein